MGISVMAGRAITWTDILKFKPVALISENLAREYARVLGCASEGGWPVDRDVPRRAVPGNRGGRRCKDLDQILPCDPVAEPAVGEAFNEELRLELMEMAESGWLSA
jgi:hypothetical protein